MDAEEQNRFVEKRQAVLSDSEELSRPQSNWDRTNPSTAQYTFIRMVMPNRSTGFSTASVAD